jgi:hypothetical protein
MGTIIKRHLGAMSEKMRFVASLLAMTNKETLNDTFLYVFLKEFKNIDKKIDFDIRFAGS